MSAQIILSVEKRSDGYYYTSVAGMRRDQCRLDALDSVRAAVYSIFDANSYPHVYDEQDRAVAAEIVAAIEGKAVKQ